MEELLTTAELADRLKVSGKTIERMLVAGRLPYVRVAGKGAGHRRFVWSEVLQSLREDTERHEEGEK
tara:strand:+ start:2067 stop:2267 length:201 start_codon:yes stop_codon:yes gene_type:complete